MADNTQLNQATTIGDEIATLDVAGIKHEKVIVEYLVGGVPTMVSAANLLPVTDAVAEAALASIAAEDFATQTTLAAILAKIIAAPATEATLASILAKIIAAPSTEAKQDVIITALNAIDAGSAAALGQAAMAASVPVVIASNQSAVPISGTVTVDTSLLATAAKQDTQITAEQAILAKIIAAPATEAKQDTQITAEQAIQAAVQIMDDWDESDRAKVNVIAGQAGIAGGTGTDGATVPRVTLATNVGLPAGANLLGIVQSKDLPDAASTYALTNVTSTAYEASHVLKASAGYLFMVTGYNSRTSSQFIQLFNSATVPADTAVPVIIFRVPASSNFSLDLGKYGRYFSTGIAISNSSTGPTKTIGTTDTWYDAQII